MSIPTMIAIYFIIWWTVLFAVLPWGVRSQHESGEEISAGTDPGAPLVPQLLRKAMWTTVAATVVFVAFYVIYFYRLITLDGLAAFFGIPG